MLVQFIGAPCSGKTTVAAKLFAMLKESGHPCEFIAEQARVHIALKRWHRARYGEQGEVKLSDGDQGQIMSGQALVEEAFLQTCPPEVVIVTDTSPLNTLLYMSEPMRGSPEVQDLAGKVVARTDLVFYCPPVEPPTLPDPNRLHTKEACLVVDGWIPKVIPQEVLGKMTHLRGGQEARACDAYALVLHEIYRRVRG